MNKNELIAEVLSARPWRDNRAQDAVEVSVTYSVRNTDIALLKINGNAVRRDANGKATVKLQPGKHLIEWRAYGPPSTDYEISIDSPEAIKWTPDPPLSSDSTGFIANRREFEL